MRPFCHGLSLAASALLAFVLILGLGSAARTEGAVTSLPDPARGKALAERLCTNCHLVSDRQTKAVADVPSFAAIANKPDQTEGAVMARIVMPMHPMPVIPITKPELEDVSAYIMSLRGE
ncbi:c-type cytochrome [Methyloceanibacter methanicus]|uniref:c-type cytochrome n=1 Tax=Methyloceanibacter methanicus TaxID=1774968 RepID=UPI00114CC255|nr:c-type cytochrome [Methyloceanibacter methanicus]